MTHKSNTTQKSVASILTKEDLLKAIEANPELVAELVAKKVAEVSQKGKAERAQKSLEKARKARGIMGIQKLNIGKDTAKEVMEWSEERKRLLGIKKTFLAISNKADQSEEKIAMRDSFDTSGLYLYPTASGKKALVYCNMTNRMVREVSFVDDVVEKRVSAILSTIPSNERIV